MPDRYYTVVGEESKGILDELRKITKLEMSKIYKNTDNKAKLQHSKERILKKK